MTGPNINHAVTASWWHPESPASHARVEQVRDFEARDTVAAAAVAVTFLMLGKGP